MLKKDQIVNIKKGGVNEKSMEKGVNFVQNLRVITAEGGMM